MDTLLLNNLDRVFNLFLSLQFEKNGTQARSRCGQTIAIDSIWFLGRISVMDALINNLNRVFNLFLSLQFEKTADHLFEAAYYGQKDTINGMSVHT